MLFQNLQEMAVFGKVWVMGGGLMEMIFVMMVVVMMGRGS